MTVLSRLLVVVMLTLVLAGCGDSPGARAKKFFVGLQKGDIDKAMDLVPPEARPNDRLELGKAGLAMASALFKAVVSETGEIKVDKEEISGDQATVTLSIPTKDSKPLVQVVTMKRISGTWYLAEQGIASGRSMTGRPPPR